MNTLRPFMIQMVNNTEITGSFLLVQCLMKYVPESLVNFLSPSRLVFYEVAKTYNYLNTEVVSY
jgi:hypothetical protein